ALRELTPDDIQKISDTYHSWRNEGGNYQDQQGFCKSAKIDEIIKHDYILTPGRYVGIEDEEDDGIPFEDKMAELTAKLSEQFSKSNQLEEEIKKNLKSIGFEI
ncbi:MAG: N-6 DNA methylase, partial [Spirochaetales bacterium]|nr:N-6 DNA methylase [Spirochaetales bacterium]